MHLIVLSFLLTLILPLLSHADLEPDFTEYKAEINTGGMAFP